MTDVKYYAQFMEYNLKGVLDLALGSDGVFILDGRKTLEHMIEDAKEQMHRLRFVQTYSKFRIMKGNFRESKIVYKNYENQLEVKQ